MKQALLLTGIMASFTPLAAPVFEDGFEATVSNDHLIALGDAYDAAQVPIVPATPSGNLLKNPSFETNSNDWFTCNVTPKYDTDASDGSRARQFSFNEKCSGGLYGLPYYVTLSQSGLKLDKNATAYTLFLDLKFDDTEEKSVNIIFDNTPNRSNISFDYSKLLAFQPMDTGWHTYRLVLSAAQVGEHLNDWANASLAINIGEAQNRSFAIDNVRLYKGDYSDTNVTTMPASLRNSKARVLIQGWHNDQWYYGSMTVGGDDVQLYKNLTQQKLYNGRLTHYENDLFVGDKYFVSKAPDIVGIPEPDVIVAPSADIKRFDSKTGLEKQPSPIKRFIGTPGKQHGANFGDSAGDVAALGYEYIGTVFAPAHDRAVYSLCAASFDKALAMTTIPVCGFYLESLSGEKINGEASLFIQGQKIVNLSQQGKLAWRTKLRNVVIADKNGANQHAYSMNGTTATTLIHLTWANNSERLAMLLSAGGGVAANNDNIDLLVIANLSDPAAPVIEHSIPLGISIESAGQLTWTADDQFILYPKAKKISADNYDYRTWWIEPSTGKRGMVTPKVGVIAYGLAP